MWQNNKTHIQISSQNVNFSKEIKQYLILCHQVLQINQQILIYLPYVEQPARQAFEKLFNVQVTNRQSREIKAIHLASSYFATQDQERQYYLKDRFVGFLNKLRIVPPKIRILLELEQLVRKIKRGIKKILILLKKTNQNQQKHQLNLDEVIRPNEVIKRCQQLSSAVKTVSQTGLNKERTLISESATKMKTKSQVQKFYAQKQFSLQSNFITILLWRYETCTIASLIMLQKQCKQLSIKYIKQTKKLIKSSLINSEQIVKIYTFCLSNIFRKQINVGNVQKYIYFRLELKKLLGQRKNQLSSKVIQQAQNVIKKVKEVAQKEVLKKYAEKSQNDIKILQKQHQVNNFFLQQKNLNNQKSPTFDNRLKNKYTLNLKQKISTSPSFQNRPFLTTNRFSLASMSKHAGMPTQNESESLNKIKQYQLSLRKARKENLSNQKKLMNSKGETVRSMYEGLRMTQNGQFAGNIGLNQKKFKNVSFAVQNDQSQRSLKPRNNNSKHKNQKTSFIKNKHNNRHDPAFTSHSMPFTQRIYQSLRQKNSHHQQISIMSLQNEMFMAPQVIYQKPRITFEQITRDLRFICQIKNDSQSSTMGQVVNEIIMARIQCKVSCMAIINGGDVLNIDFMKAKDETEKFKCIIRQNQQFVTKVKFQIFQQAVTLKATKSSVQATDLFFELMQNDIKALRPQATSKFLIQLHNLQQLEQKDNQTYLGYYNVFNAISIMTDYIKPYLFWYWTRRSKMNGLTFAKRQKLQMSDPLKFSINLESFKKNDFQGCVELFKTVRNKKGLKQCISYLSQDRQILCRHLSKDSKGKYFLQILQIQSKHIRNFQISSQNELIFPVLKLVGKKYKLDQEYKTKNNLLIQRTFKKLLISGQERKTLKKKSNQINPLQTNPSSVEEKIDMRKIFNNAQCNQVVINNLNQNFISSRFTLRMIDYLEKNSKKQQQEWKKIEKQIFARQQQKKERRIYEQETEDNKIEVEMRNEEHKRHEDNEDLTEALRNYIVSILGGENQQLNSEQIQGSRKDERKSTQKLTRKISNNRQLSQMNNIYIKQKYTLQYVIHHKLTAFTNFLIAISQTYEQSTMFSILKMRTKKIKIAKQFLELTIYKFVNQCYFVVLKDDRSEKQWAMYISQKIIKMVDLLMLNEEERSFCDENGMIVQVQIQSNEQRRKSDRYNSNNYFEQMKLLKLQKQLSNQVSFLEHNQSSQSSCSQTSFSSQRQMKSEKSQCNTIPNAKISYLLKIFNSQSQRFHLKLLKTPYLNKLTIHRKYTGKYLVNRVNSKNNKFSILVNWMHVMEKKIIKIKDVCSKNSFNFGKYVYFALSYDMKFNYWRFDIYLQYTQQKYVAFINEKSIQVKKKLSTEKVLTELIQKNTIKFDLHSHRLFIEQKSYKIFQTFDQLTLPHKQISAQLYESYLTQKQKTLNQKTLHKIFNSRFQNKQPISQQIVIKNSGLFQLLKYKQQIFLFLLDYKRNHILVSQLQEDPQYFFTNIYAECLHKETKNVIYQNLLRRTYQKVERNTIMLNQMTIEDFGRAVQ